MLTRFDTEAIDRAASTMSNQVGTDADFSGLATALSQHPRQVFRDLRGRVSYYSSDNLRHSLAFWRRRGHFTVVRLPAGMFANHPTTPTLYVGVVPRTKYRPDDSERLKHATTAYTLTAAPGGCRVAETTSRP